MKDSTCFSVFCWIFQILVWGSLILLILSIVSEAKMVGPVLIFCACYIVYIILEFCSSVAKYLCNKTTEGGIYQKMVYIIEHIPYFNFIVNATIMKKGFEK